MGRTALGVIKESSMKVCSQFCIKLGILEECNSNFTPEKNAENVFHSKKKKDDIFLKNKAWILWNFKSNFEIDIERCGTIFFN